MRFEFYSEHLDNVPKLSVDGTVANSIHFSHWEGNQTPHEVKADTSTEIALNLVASPDRKKLTGGIDLVTNNHFDTDGVLSVWTVINGEKSLEFRAQLIAAAEAGDFSEFPNESAVRTSIVIQGPEQASSSNDSGSPLARHLAGAVVKDDARAYELVLPEIENVLTNIDAYEPLWRQGWKRIATTLESFERGDSAVEEFGTADLSVITLAPEAFGSSGFDPNHHSIPYTVISRYAKGQLYLITTEFKGGCYYQLDYPYYSWAETVVRPRIPRRELDDLLSTLNDLEQHPNGQWLPDNSEMTSAAKVVGQGGKHAPSSLNPEDVVKILEAGLALNEAAVARS
jgi:hypothetical protein